MRRERFANMLQCRGNKGYCAVRVVAMILASNASMQPCRHRLGRGPQPLCFLKSLECKPDSDSLPSPAHARAAARPCGDRLPALLYTHPLPILIVVDATGYLLSTCVTACSVTHCQGKCSCHSVSGLTAESKSNHRNIFGMLEFTDAA